MTGDIEPIRDSPAASAAASVDVAMPAAAETSQDGHTAERACLNCGTALLGPHCHSCGQRAHVHKTLAAFFHDLLHGVFHFEGKIWRTLPVLAWRPGRLTREYIDGRRASYISPIALFLFVVFVTSALFAALGSQNFDASSVADQAEQGTQVATDKLDDEIAKATAERTAAISTGKSTAAIDQRLEELRKDRRALDGFVFTDDTNVSGQGTAGTALATGLNAAFEKAKNNPTLAVYKLQTNAYKYSWLLVPLSVPFVLLLFPFSRRFGIYDHTVFVTYSISFMLILLGAASLAVYADWGPLVTLPFLYAPFHMYRQLKETYALRRFGALWRTAFLSMFAAMALLLFALTVVFLTIA